MSQTPVSDAELDARFAPIYRRIAEGAVAREQQRTLAFEPVAWLREAGLGALRVPQSHGGLGASLAQLLRQLVRLGQADSNLPQIFRAHFGFVEGRLASNDAASQDYWFARVVAGELWGAAMAERSDSTGNTVQLSDTQDGYRLDGEKYYCTGTLYADWVAAVANHGDDFVSLAVPTGAPGVERLDDWDGFGQRLTGSGTTRFTQVSVRPTTCCAASPRASCVPSLISRRSTRPCTWPPWPALPAPYWPMPWPSFRVAPVPLVYRGSRSRPKTRWCKQ